MKKFLTHLKIEMISTMPVNEYTEFCMMIFDRTINNSPMLQNSLPQNKKKYQHGNGNCIHWLS